MVKVEFIAIPDGAVDEDALSTSSMVVSGTAHHTDTPTCLGLCP